MSDKGPRYRVGRSAVNQNADNLREEYGLGRPGPIRHNIMAPEAETAVRDYFKRAGLLVEDLTDSEDTAYLGEADTFCCVALVAQMLQKEERKL